MWWIAFPGRPGIVSAAGDAGEIVAEAQDTLETVLTYPPGDDLPRSIEDGATSPTDLSDFARPVPVVAFRFEPVAEKAAA